MAKRFLDTSIFRDPSVRAMKAPYKVLYLYLLCECDHAGVWICEMDVAALRLGMKLGGRDEVLAELAGAVIDLGGGAWYLVDFVRSQYGTLNPANRVHASVMDRLQGLGLDPLNLPENKPLTSPLQGCKDKDKDKDNSEKKEVRRTAIAVPRATTPEEFRAQCAAVAAEHPDLLPPSLRKGFLEYWTERDAQGRMRLQAEKHFEIPRRMNTWRTNAEKRGEIPVPAPERKTGWLTPDGK